MPLKDKAAGLDHALRVVREVRAAANYEQTGLIIVRDEMQQMVQRPRFPSAAQPS
jgi:hypothetical protein